MENTVDNTSSQENFKPKQKKNSRVLLIAFIIALIGGVVYLVFDSINLRDQNEFTQAELDEAINDLDSMSTELDSRILKIAQLGGEIDTLIAIKNQLEEEKKAFEQRTYKKINDLQGRVNGYKEMLLSQDKEIERLKKVNEALLGENTELKSEANELNKSIKALNNDREDLENKVALASRLKIEGLRIYAVSSSGKERENTFRNRHIDDLKIEFDVLENKVAPIEGKEILVKITDPDANVIFDVASGSGTFMFENRESFYTAKKEILYDRNTQSLTYLYQKGSDYAVGSYKVEVYTEDYKMGEGNFIVK